MRRLLCRSLLSLAAMLTATGCDGSAEPLGADASVRSDSGGGAQPDAAADAAPRGASLGPACAMLSTCCGELPGAVFGQPCVTAGQGDEAACQAVIDQARGIDRCRAPAVDAG